MYGVIMMDKSNESVVDTNNDPAINKYYESVAVAFRYAKFITLFVAIVFIMFILSFFRDEVSLENFQYMLKYITSEDASLITTQKIHYPTSDSKALDLFSGDFVSAGSGGVSLYDTNGNTVLEIKDTFSEPVFTIGKKYGLCYDLSGYSYVIFNTFSKLYSQELDFPISDAIMSDSGSYSVLTKSREYRTVINVHDSDYDHICTVYDNKYTFDMDMTSKHLAYLTAEARDSSYLTYINVLKIKNEDSKVVEELYNEFPIGIRFVGDNLTVITDSAIRFYDRDFNRTSMYSFSSRMPSGFESSDNTVMLYFEKNTIGSENEVRFYSQSGELLFSGVLPGKVNSIDINDTYAIIHTNDTVYRVNIDERTVVSEKIDTGAEKAMLQSDSSVLVCYKNYAKLIDFADSEESYFSYRS
ncbi:MAG: hypothetical protein IJ391_03905 [Clostridia bacterium]|nr:hypothetical protein [Clostridia bacterium]